MIRRLKSISDYERLGMQGENHGMIWSVLKVPTWAAV